MVGKRRTFRNLDELMAAVVTGEVGSVLHAITIHEDRCTPGVCTCEPEYVLEDATPENLRQGAALEAAWKRDKTN